VALHEVHALRAGHRDVRDHDRVLGGKFRDGRFGVGAEVTADRLNDSDYCQTLARTGARLLLCAHASSVGAADARLLHVRSRFAKDTEPLSHIEVRAGTLVLEWTGQQSLQGGPGRAGAARSRDLELTFTTPDQKRYSRAAQWNQRTHPGCIEEWP
jgi:hypothetical protein